MKHKKSEPLKTILVLVVACVIAYLATLLRGLLYASLLIGFAGLASERLAYFIDLGWTKLGKALSFVVPNILLTLIFYVMLFPLSLLSRLFKKNDPLLLSNTAKSTFISATKTFPKQSFERPW